MRTLSFSEHGKTNELRLRVKILAINLPRKVKSAILALRKPDTFLIAAELFIVKISLSLYFNVTILLVWSTKQPQMSDKSVPKYVHTVFSQVLMM